MTIWSVKSRVGSAKLMRGLVGGLAVVAALCLLTSCSGWNGANSLPLPGTEGSSDGAFEVRIQMPNVNNIERNSVVMVDDVNVGTVSDIRRQQWHALVTVKINENVNLPANATATIGQTSLLGTLHIALAAPVDEEPRGRLLDGALIPLARAGGYPTTEQTLASVSTVLNGGGLAQLQDINKQLDAALGGHQKQARSLIKQLDVFTGSLNEQKDEIVRAIGAVDRLAQHVNDRSASVDRALDSIPPALEVLAKDRDSLRSAITSMGEFARLSDQVVRRSRDSLSDNLSALAPTLRELANAGPNLTRSLGLLATFPWPQEGIKKFIRGDAGNLSATIDLTLGRADNSYLQMTPADGDLTALETLLGRTVGRQPTPETKNPLEAPILRGGR